MTMNALSSLTGTHSLALQSFDQVLKLTCSPPCAMDQEYTGRGVSALSVYHSQVSALPHLVQGVAQLVTLNLYWLKHQALFSWTKSLQVDRPLPQNLMTFYDTNQEQVQKKEDKGKKCPGVCLLAG